MDFKIIPSRPHPKLLIYKLAHSINYHTLIGLHMFTLKRALPHKGSKSEVHMHDVHNAIFISSNN
jgi:hypothetical protein